METVSTPFEATLRRAELDGEPTWVLTHPDGARLVVAETGATVLAWQAPGADGTLVDLLDGYRSAAELVAQDGYRSAVLVPWSNRVRDARYTFAGVTHELAPDERVLVGADGRDVGMHGLLTSVRWTRSAVEVRDSDRAIRLEAAITPETNPGYPFSLQVTATYSLGIGAEGEARLGLELEATNVGAGPAPVTLGWHPYLRLPGHDTIDDLELTVPARSRVLTDAALIPLAGEQAFSGVTAPVRMPLGGVALDDAYTDLVPDDDGVVTTVLRSPRTGESLTVEQEPFQSQVVHVYTGDSLEREPRASVAVEPCQALTNAFNRPGSAAVVVLAPSESRQLVSDIVYRHRHRHH
ncbi:MAG: aldose epimerase family protein [Georgenia sp.]